MDIDSKKLVDMIYCNKCNKYMHSLEFEGHECLTQNIIDMTSNAEVIKNEDGKEKVL